MAPSAPFRRHDSLYVDGGWKASVSPSNTEVVNPTTEDVMGLVPAGAVGDAEQAVAAAGEAFAAWSQTSLEHRVEVLGAIAGALQARAEEIGDLCAAEVGTPRDLSVSIHGRLPALDFSTTAVALAHLALEEEVGRSLVVREPVGTVGAITPWDHPLHHAAAKVAPALAAGCTVVLKPSERAPLTAFLLAEVIDAVGVPPGVFNLVTGPGRVVGNTLVAEPGLEMVSFTGSTEAGRRVQAVAARTIKRVILELGGKSANVILDDADLEMAVTGGVDRCFVNSGQTCTALSRMVVPRARLAEVEEIAGEVAAGYTPGDPFAEGARMGPVGSASQRERVRAAIRRALDEGARLVTGGPERPHGLDRGFFVRPTVLSGVTGEMAVARKEVFGPVLAILAHDGDDDAVRVANDSIYGLAGAVWSADPDRALAVARRMRAGQVGINGAGFEPSAPFGGYRQSGNGREMGRAGIEEYLETKAILR